VPSGTKAEDQPARTHLVDGIGHLGEQRRVAERRAHDQRPELDARRGLGQGREQRPTLPDPTSLTVPLE
jgi:hypothetical protein